jgi:hypothetical protein
MSPQGPYLPRSERGGPNWLARALLISAGAVLAAISIFFITIALIAGSVLAVVIALRWWWVTRRLRAARSAEAALEGEYTIVRSPELDDVRR